jgi:outer membrane protein TolC
MRRAEIQEEQAELYLLQTANSLETNLRNLYQQIQVAEQQIQNNQTLFREANQVFENALKSLQESSSFNRLDLKDAITQLRNAEIQLTNAILQHYSLKLQIAELIGVDNFSEDKK